MLSNMFDSLYSFAREWLNEKFRIPYLKFQTTSIEAKRKGPSEVKIISYLSSLYIYHRVFPHSSTVGRFYLICKHEIIT